MTALKHIPRLSVEGEDRADRAARMSRLFRALDTMCAIVRILWPGEDVPSRDPHAVRWEGALVRLHEDEGHLYAMWKDEDYWEKYAKVVELAWGAVGYESGRVIHDNADLNGLRLPQTEPMF